MHLNTKETRINSDKYSTEFLFQLFKQAERNLSPKKHYSKQIKANNIQLISSMSNIPNEKYDLKIAEKAMRAKLERIESSLRIIRDTSIENPGYFEHYRERFTIHGLS